MEVVSIDYTIVYSLYPLLTLKLQFRMFRKEFLDQEGTQTLSSNHSRARNKGTCTTYECLTLEKWNDHN